MCGNSFINDEVVIFEYLNSVFLVVKIFGLKEKMRFWWEFVIFRWVIMIVFVGKCYGEYFVEED